MHPRTDVGGPGEWQYMSDSDEFRERLFSGQIEAELEACSRATAGRTRAQILEELRDERSTLRELIEATSPPAPALVETERRIAEILAREAKRWFDEMEAKDMLWDVALSSAPPDIREESTRRFLAAHQKKDAAANERTPRDANAPRPKPPIQKFRRK